MFNKKKEITHEEALEINYKFGQKCYKKGYTKGYLAAKLETFSCSMMIIAAACFMHKYLDVSK